MSASIPNRPGNTATLPQFPYNKLLLVFFLLSLPLVNPTVHGDGVGYYAYARALLIQNSLRFEEDRRRSNARFSAVRVQADDQLAPSEYTSFRYVDNHLSSGLRSIALVPGVAHVAVLMVNVFGAKIRADGFPTPYLVAMAVGTAVWGFLGLLLSFFLGPENM